MQYVSNHIDKELQPIIKWPGGKEKELSLIFANAPMHFDHYYEPFVGGGSVYASFKSSQYFINDKSNELISLYRSIAEQRTGFYDWIGYVMTAWRGMLAYVAEHRELVVMYEYFRDKDVADSVIKHELEIYITHDFAKLSEVLPSAFVWKKDCYLKELRTNVCRKIMRTRKIEKERGKMPDDDLYDNVETAFMSALYMYFRSLYNDKVLCAQNEDLSTALFLFIRNYAYSGMFRYNNHGEFNVPYGGIAYNHKLLEKKVAYYQSTILLKHLENTTIESLDFEDFFRRHTPTENDFIFLDPPYDSEFCTYAQNEFTAIDQQRLADYLCNVCRAKWLMIIKYTPFIHSLYNRPELNIKAFDTRYIVSFMNRNDKNAKHLIITNY